MCLYVTSKKVRVAKEDMVCYKILDRKKERKKWIFRIFRKPTYRAPFYFNYIYQLKKLNDLGKFLYVAISPEELCGVVHEGFHSFVDIQDAKRMLSEWYETHVGVIVKCIIPKGAEYVKGTIYKSQNSPACYVSNQIICVKEV